MMMHDSSVPPEEGWVGEPCKRPHVCENIVTCPKQTPAVAAIIGAPKRRKGPRKSKWKLLVLPTGRVVPAKLTPLLTPPNPVAAPDRETQRGDLLRSHDSHAYLPVLRRNGSDPAVPAVSAPITPGHRCFLVLV